MAKVKLKTNAKPKTVREGSAPETGRATRRTAKSTTRNTARSTSRNTKRSKDYDDAPEKKGSGGTIAIILMLVLIIGGGAGGYIYIVMNKEVQKDYIVTAEEKTFMAGVDKRIQNVQLDVTNLEYLMQDVNKFGKDLYHCTGCGRTTGRSK